MLSSECKKAQKMQTKTANCITILYLLLAILFEVAGTTSMKLSQGFSHFLPSILLFVFYFVSFGFLSLSLKRLDLSFAYAVWAGLGTGLIALVGVCYFHEPINAFKAFSLLLIVAGIVGLKWKPKVFA